MTLKLSLSEMIALHDLFKNHVIIDHRSFSAHKKLQVAVLQRTYKRIYQKLFTHKPKYTLTLEPDEAIAFYLFFTSNQVSAELVFENNLIRQVNNSINQKFIV